MELAHVRRGSGEPLVLIHGIGSEWAIWEPILDRLAAERDVVALDMPGFGDSPPLPADRRPSPRALAEAVAAFMGREIGDEPVEVVGWSLGGWVALELAKLGFASRVVAVAPAGFWTSRERAFARAQLRAAIWLARHATPLAMALVGTDVGRALALSGTFSRPGRLPPEAARRLIAKLVGSTAFDETLDLVAADHFTDADGIRVPVTVVWGGRDRLLLPTQAKRAERAIPGARLVMAPEAGHAVMWDAPDVLVEAVLGRYPAAAPAGASAR